MVVGEHITVSALQIQVGPNERTRLKRGAG